MNNMNITIGQYVKGDSLLHKLDPRFKLISTIILMVSVFLIPTDSLLNFYFLLGFLAFFIILLIVCKINIIAVLRGLQPILLIGIFTFVLQIIYNKDDVLLFPINFSFSWISIVAAVMLLLVWFFTRKIAPIKVIHFILLLTGLVLIFALVKTNYDFFTVYFPVSQGGFLKGLFFFVRIILIVVLSTILTISTSTTDINLGLEWILHPLSFIKIPVAEIAMMFSLTLRFIPTLLIEANKIMRAQASRGIDFNEGNLFDKVKQIVTLLIPMFFISITRAEDMANAMEARGYVIGAKRSNIDELKFHLRDYLSFIVVLIMLAFTIYLQVA